MKVCFNLVFEFKKQALVGLSMVINNNIQNIQSLKKITQPLALSKIWNKCCILWIESLSPALHLNLVDSLNYQYFLIRYFLDNHRLVNISTANKSLQIKLGFIFSLLSINSGVDRPDFNQWSRQTRFQPVE